MSDLTTQAAAVLKAFKGNAYAFGNGVLVENTGKYTAEFGKKAMLIGPISSDWFKPIQERIMASLKNACIEVVDIVRSAAPNAPFVDVYRIHSHIMHKHPDVIVE